MAKMKPSADVDGIWSIDSDVWLDNHGYYTDSVWEMILQDTEAKSFVWERIWYVQSNTIKGFYLPKSQPDSLVYTLFTPLDGDIVLFVVDLRKGSPTEKKYCRYELSFPSKQILIPPGCAFGFFVSGEFSLVSIKQNISHPQEVGIYWNDTELDVIWGNINPKNPNTLYKNYYLFRDVPKEFILDFVEKKKDEPF